MCMCLQLQKRFAVLTLSIWRGKHCSGPGRPSWAAGLGLWSSDCSNLTPCRGWSLTKRLRSPLLSNRTSIGWVELQHTAACHMCCTCVWYDEYSCLLQSQYDTPLLELISIENEIKLATDKLAEWAAPRPVERNLLTISDEVYIQPEPLGVVLIIGAWNYPWALTLLPLVGAIAAGREPFRLWSLKIPWELTFK